MAVRRIADPEPEQIISRRLARAPVINGVVLGAVDVVKTETLKDDLGQRLVGTVHEDGRVELAEPTDRRIFFTGWVH